MTQVMETDQFDIHGAALSRRGFLGTGGALLVMLGLPAGRASAQTTSLDAAKPASWIEIHADSTVTMRTGKCDFGQSSIYTAYRQIVAEELGMSVEAITTVVAGDTDRTPDGGGTGLLRNAGTNMRKAAAYTREAVLELAAQRFGVPRSAFGGQGRDHRRRQERHLWRNHCGPDLAPDHTHRRLAHRFSRAGGHRQSAAQKLADYTEVGKPVTNPIIAPKVSGKTQWVGDVKLPDMLHARVIHPRLWVRRWSRRGGWTRRNIPARNWCRSAICWPSSRPMNGRR
jgi:hypothetical protein